MNCHLFIWLGYVIVIFYYIFQVLSLSFYEIALIDIGLRNYSRQVLLGPLFRRHVLLEYHHLLEPHLFELLGILQNNGSQNIQANPEVVVFDGQVGIVESETGFHGKLPEEEASHPLEVHVIKVYILFREMGQKLRVDSLDNFLYSYK